MAIVEIAIVSADPEIYCLTVYGEKVGVGTYAEMFALGADYDSAFEPEKGWQAVAEENLEEHWARRLRQTRACQAVIQQAEARRRAELTRAEMRRAYVASAPAPRPIRSVKSSLTVVKPSANETSSVDPDRP